MRILSGISLLSILLGNTIYAQEVKIREVKLADSLVEVHYELLDDNPDRSFTISLYTSRDNFIQPLNAVEGDVGIDIKVGGNKVAYWNAKKELGRDFNGALSLEIKGNIYIPFITLDGLEEGMVFKRGKPNDFIWSGGRGDNVLNFELYRGNNLIKVFEERPNIGNTSLIIPTDVKPGHNYRYRISDTRNKDEVVFTNTFTIKRKVPLAVKIGLAAIVGGVVGYIIGNSGTETTPEIQEPPLPTRQ